MRLRIFLLSLSDLFCSVLPIITTVPPFFEIHYIIALNTYTNYKLEHKIGTLSMSCIVDSRSSRKRHVCICKSYLFFHIHYFQFSFHNRLIDFIFVEIL